MSQTDFEERIKEVFQSLAEDQLEATLQQIENLLLARPHWELSSRLEKVKTSYHYLLQYLLQGIDDPQRDTLRLKLKAETYQIAVCLYQEILAAGHGNDLYYHTLQEARALQQRGETLPHLLAGLETLTDNLSVLRLTDPRRESLLHELELHERRQEHLFNAVWTSAEWTSEDLDAATGALYSDTLLQADLCLLLSAVTLSQHYNLDKRKMLFVVDACMHDDVAVRVRAIVCLLVCLSRQGHWLSLFPELSHRIEILKADEDFRKEAGKVYLQMLRARDTDQVTQRMRNEIMPEMMKNIKNFKLNIEETEEDMNPEWEKKQQEIDETLRKMHDLLLEGDDVHMVSFSMLKGFPFFRHIAHWFLPYYEQHSLVMKSAESEPDSQQLIHLLVSGTGLCDNDKYSLLCAFPSISRQQQHSLMGQLVSEENRELIKENLEEIQKYARRTEVVAQNYVQGLYRFFKLFPQSIAIKSIFQRLDYYADSSMRPLFQEDELVQEIGRVLTKSGHYEEAIQLYKTYYGTHPDSPEVCQKLGYLYQKMKKYHSAIVSLQTAEAAAPDNSWTLRHLATCHRLAGHYEEATAYYEKVLRQQPGNKNALYYQAVCLQQSGDDEEALKKFFQLEWTDEGNLLVRRSIGLCSLRLKKYEQAERYLQELATASSLPQDFLRWGHACLLQHRISEAIRCYQEADRLLRQEDTDNSLTLSDLFAIDEDMLRGLGISPQFFPLLQDLAMLKD